MRLAAVWVKDFGNTKKGLCPSRGPFHFIFGHTHCILIEFFELDCDRVPVDVGVPVQLGTLGGPHARHSEHAADLRPVGLRALCEHLPAAVERPQELVEAVAQEHAGVVLELLADLVN